MDRARHRHSSRFYVSNFCLNIRARSLAHLAEAAPQPLGVALEPAEAEL